MYIQRSDTIVANTTNDNVLAGNQFEFAPTRSIVEIAVIGSAIGLEVDILIGARAVVTRLIPLLKATAAIYPDDFLRAGAQQGERIIIRIRNTTGGNLIALTSVRFTPV